MSTRGIVTIATGKPIYKKMAHDLALSLRLHSPSIETAVLTDDPDDPLFAPFDRKVAVRPEYGDGFYQKLSMHKYDLWDETLFIDGDCLVVGDLDEVWRRFDGHEFCYSGRVKTEGVWYQQEIAELLPRLGLPHLCILNSGMLYFRSGELVSRVFERAMQFMRDEYVEKGFPSFKGSRADEPGLAIALTENDIRPLDDEGTSMRTPIGIRGPMRINARTGGCSFNKAGEMVEPRIVHFATWQHHPVYIRERARLRLNQSMGVPGPLADAGASLIYAAASVARPIAKALRGRR